MANAWFTGLVKFLIAMTADRFMRPSIDLLIAIKELDHAAAQPNSAAEVWAWIHRILYILVEWTKSIKKAPGAYLFFEIQHSLAILTPNCLQSMIQRSVLNECSRYRKIPRSLRKLHRRSTTNSTPRLHNELWFETSQCALISVKWSSVQRAMEAGIVNFDCRHVRS